MKTHTIKTPKAELLVVELSRKADVEIFPNSIEIYNQFTGQEESIKGSYTPLSNPDEISEEDARELVETFSVKSGMFTDYIRPECGYRTAKESLLSLIESEIYWENPYRITGMNKEYIELKDWDRNFTEAESRTFDRNRSLIFKKNK